MPIKRIIPCLDVKDGRVVKGIKFEGLSDVASPVELAKRYCEDGADELVFYDITASVEGRELNAEVLRQVAKEVTIPFAVGGGINTLDDFERVLSFGANKISVNTGVLKNPGIIGDAARKFSSACVVFAVDVKQVDGKYHIFTKGGKEDTGIEAIEWIKRGAENGAGELVINSIDTDGVRNGFDIPLLRAVCEAVSIPVIASGGAGKIEDFITLFKELPQIDAGLAASVFHFGEVKIPELKQALYNNGIDVLISE